MKGKMRSIILNEVIIEGIIENPGKAIQIDIPKNRKFIEGEVLWVKEDLWESDCGNYYARMYYPPSYYDVLSIDGKNKWLWSRNKQHSPYPEFPFMVSSYSFTGHYKRNGRRVEAFTLGFSDHDINVEIKPFTGNTILVSYKSNFRKKINARYMPQWASRITLEVETVNVEIGTMVVVPKIEV